MLNAIAAFLETLPDIPPVFLDYLPDQPDECVGLFCWDYIAPPMADGSATRFVQIRVRAKTWSRAMDACARIASALDSGANEMPLPIDWPGSVIGRTRRLPVLMDRDSQTVTVYSEVSLWGTTS